MSSGCPSSTAPQSRRKIGICESLFRGLFFFDFLKKKSIFYNSIFVKNSLKEKALLCNEK